MADRTAAEGDAYLRSQFGQRTFVAVEDSEHRGADDDDPGAGRGHDAREELNWRGCAERDDPPSELVQRDPEARQPKGCDGPLARPQ
jgi:hypothetical protein